ncbi:protein takeout-like [Coccinella septempunctata]|uniref:protein takeout-like n=1 Tax=Coccinella septempunctata TaxID=41139 RepID=UPI001D05D287|nr:protein takeout-like [Coccinella septempunctata]
MNTLISISVCAVLCVIGIEAKGIPSYITLCKRNDPELEKCILRAVDAIQPHLKKGIPELGIPSLDPLTIPFAGLETGPSFNASFKDIEVYNADEFKITKFQIDLDKVILDVALSFPKLRIKSKYAVDGKILFLELKGAGPADGNFTNVQAELLGNGRKIEKNGKTYLEIQDVKVNGNYGKPVFLFADLFENKEVNDQTNKIINDNIEEIIKELEPVVNKVVIEIVQSLVSRVFVKYSFDELFPK